MAGGVWEAMQMKASAKARFDAQGHLTVSSATTDIGTGTYTVMTQIAADAAGARVQDVTFVLGDSSLPTAPLQGGSFTVSSVGSAVRQACQVLRTKVLEHARRMYPQVASTAREQIIFADGYLHAGSHRLALADIIASAPKVSSKCKSTPSPAPDANRSPPLPIRQYSRKSTSTRTLAQSR